MRKTGFLYEKQYLQHITSPYHPEVPERLTAIWKGVLEADYADKLTIINARPAEGKWVQTVHHLQYVYRLKKACETGMKDFDYPDNRLCGKTLDIAILAVGGVLETAKEMMDGKIDNGFCAIRPPGHHAEYNRAMGFCYLNNTAIAARYLQMEYRVERIMIADIDVHHGNGTQMAFETDPGVFYYSIHEHPSFSFPGTGREFEKGRDNGYGFTMNATVLPGKGDKEYREILEKTLLPAADAFRPQVVLVSMGFDAHKEDEMSGIRLTTPCFTWIMERIMEMADRYAGGRVLSILEGGYEVDTLAELSHNHVEILMKGT